MPKTLKELEKKTLASNIQKEARKFYLNEANSSKERKLAFDKYGKEERYILDDSDIKDPVLQRIYARWKEYDSDLWNKYETIPLESVIEWWLDELEEHRLDLYGENSIDKTERNYKPSEKALKRLKEVLMKRVIKTGIKSFRYDW